MKLDVISWDNKKAGSIELNEAVFGLPLRKDILQRVVEWQRARKQAGTHKTKDIDEVSGTTKKPFKQKGTGNARQGTLRATHMRGGATKFGPVVRSHAYKLTKKFRQLGLKTALSVKLADGNLVILNTAALKDSKTKTLTSHLKSLSLSNALIIDVNTDENLKKAVNNVPHVDVLPVKATNVYDILKHKTLVLTEEAVKQLEERLA